MIAAFASPLCATLPGGELAPRLARAALADHFGDELEGDSLQTLKLLSSELVTNCVKHAGADAGASIEVRAWALSGCVHVEISTAARSFRSGSMPVGPAGARGRGLRVVDALSRSWGIVDNGRNTVWFKVDVEGAAA